MPYCTCRYSDSGGSPGPRHISTALVIHWFSLEFKCKQFHQIESMFWPIHNLSGIYLNNYYNFDQISGGHQDDCVRKISSKNPKDGNHEEWPARNLDENSQIIYQGYLFKQANFKIKGWKQRWFVLDSTKHELRYYDTREDFQCKGQIDLVEVTRITEGNNTTPGAPKKTEDKCFFELQTRKRDYCFCAETRQAAHEWVSKIQMCLQ